MINSKETYLSVGSIKQKSGIDNKLPVTASPGLQQELFFEDRMQMMDEVDSQPARTGLVLENLFFFNGPVGDQVQGGRREFQRLSIECWAQYPFMIEDRLESVDDEMYQRMVIYGTLPIML